MYRLRMLSRLVLALSLCIGGVAFGDSPLSQANDWFAKMLRKEAHDVLGRELSVRFKEAFQSDQNCYVLFGSHQTRKRRPMGVFLRDGEVIAHEIAWDAATQSDGTYTVDYPNTCSVDYLNCYSMQGLLKERIAKCEQHFQLGAVRVAATQAVRHAVNVEIEIEIKTNRFAEEEFGLRVDFADPHSTPRVASIPTVPAGGQKGWIRIPVTLEMSNLPPRSSAELLVDVVRIRRFEDGENAANVESASNTSITSVNVTRLYRAIADGR